MTSPTTSTPQHMYDMIAASFFQKKTCTLPGIGQLVFTSIPAITDFANNQLLAPRQVIRFTADQSTEPSFNEFSAISELMRAQLENEGKVTITGVGSFTMQQDGQVQFNALDIDPLFMQPVPAIRVIRQDTTHNVLVGDKETTSTVMNEMLHVEEQAAPKDRWWIWAIIGLAIAAAVIGYYFYQFGFNSLGNIR